MLQKIASDLDWGVQVTVCYVATAYTIQTYIYIVTTYWLWKIIMWMLYGETNDNIVIFTWQMAMVY